MNVASLTLRWTLFQLTWNLMIMFIAPCVINPRRIQHYTFSVHKNASGDISKKYISENPNLFFIVMIIHKILVDVFLNVWYIYGYGRLTGWDSERIWNAYGPLRRVWRAWLQPTANLRAWDSGWLRYVYTVVYHRRFESYRSHQFIWKIKRARPVTIC